MSLLAIEIEAIWKEQERERLKRGITYEMLWGEPIQKDSGETDCWAGTRNTQRRATE